MIDTETYVPDPRRWKALAVCFTGGFITMLDVSIVNVALPSMRTALAMGATQLQLVVAGYTLAFGLVLVPAGRLGDAIDRRRMFMIAIAGFGVMSLVAGLAQTDTQLAVARLLQGAFAGISSPQVSGMIQQMFRGRERARAFGWLGAIIGVSTAIGPLLGGLILALAGAAHGWRWVFFINVPICAVVVPLAGRFLPHTPHTGRRPLLDLVGVGLIGLATMFGMIPFVTTPDAGFFANPARWLWLVPAVALAPITYLWERRYERRTGAAVLNPALLRTRSYQFGALLGMAYFAGFTALFLIVTLMLQTGLGYSAMMAGLVALPFAVASGVSAQQSGKLVSTYGRRLVVVALVVSVAGLLVSVGVIRWVPLGVLGGVLAASLFLMGFGNGSVISPNQALAFQDVSPRLGSVAGAVLQVGQRVGTAVGTSIVLAVYTSSFASRAATAGPAAAARQAASTALSISTAFIAVALVVGILDARRRAASRK